jgi:hypothetical protein
MQQWRGGTWLGAAHLDVRQHELRADIRPAVTRVAQTCGAQRRHGKARLFSDDACGPNNLKIRTTDCDQQGSRARVRYSHVRHCAPARARKCSTPLAPCSQMTEAVCGLLGGNTIGAVSERTAAAMLVARRDAHTRVLRRNETQDAVADAARRRAILPKIHPPALPSASSWAPHARRRRGERRRTRKSRRVRTRVERRRRRPKAAVRAVAACGG